MYAYFYKTLKTLFNWERKGNFNDTDWNTHKLGYVEWLTTSSCWTILVIFHVLQLVVRVFYNNILTIWIIRDIH